MYRLARASLAGLLVVTVVESLRRTSELAGPPGARVPKPRGSIRTAADVRADLGSLVLSESTTWELKRAVESQLRGLNQEARLRYDGLRQAKLHDGSTADLTQLSESIRHNLRLLDPAK